MAAERRLFGLSSAVAISFVVKFSIFFVGVAIMGVLATRTQLTACGSNTPGNPPIFSAPYGDAEAYTDYRDLYLRCLVNPFLSGKGAYNLPIVYNYPPLFLYLISGFALLNYIWSSAIPLVFFDALTVIPLYLILKDFLFRGNSRIAFAISLFWIFNPINLFYNDLMWLNPAPTTFFVVLALYFLLKREWALSSIGLALATALKQTAVLIFPIFLIWIIRAGGTSRKKVLAYIVLFVAILVLISTPYIFQNPQLYFWALQLPIFGTPPGGSSSTPTTFTYDLSQPTRLTTFLGLVRFADLKSLAVESYLFLNYVFGLAYAILLLQFGVGIRNLRTAVSYVAFEISEKVRLSGLKIARKFKHGFQPVRKTRIYSVLERRPTANELLIYSLTAFLLFLSLFGRGDYKYYFASITPLAVPLFATKSRAIVFEIFSATLILLPREVTPWMAILLITFMPQLIGSEESSKIPEEPAIQV
jgi:hypothetical protein